LDEVRYSEVARSEDWIQTEYNNQSDVSSFLSISTTEETAGSNLFEASLNITSLPDRGSSTDLSIGYKWQLFACSDSSGLCSPWDLFDASTPNFKVDTTSPSAPGDLSLSTTTATTITLDFGAQASDANFASYKIFYKQGVTGVDTDDSEYSDSNMNYIDYNGVASTTITGLESDTEYVINIWAYDLAGNKMGATEISVLTKTAPHARARSVQFFGGKYFSPTGLSGKDSNTDHTLSNFNFSLAETDAEIRNAYIIFESQFEAYNNTQGDYTGYELSFDTCQEPCTADAWGATERVIDSSATVLAYDEAESNQIRLLFDVTDEAQLAAYSGDASNMEAQIGYKLSTASAAGSIASAKATLVVTYAYIEDSSDDYTNTVIYPLESSVSGDSGSRRAVQGDDCTRNTDCATFDYNMEIPELDTKLDQWFEVEGINDGHGGEDIEFDVNIQSVDVNSDTYYHEAANGGTQGNLPKIIFDDVFGFSENTSQSLEYYLTSVGNGSYYALGGEVIETYTAAKSASTKTRTVSFPMGVLTSGTDISTASASIDVYFPENGTGSGIVDIKKAWFRIIGDNSFTGANSLTVSSKVGDNSQSSNYIYNMDAGGNVVKSSYKIISVIPGADYTEFESANSSIPKNIVLNTTNSSSNMGGVSAELMITYTYSGESSGYLSSIDLYGDQLDDDANAQSGTGQTAASVFPEVRGEKTIRGAGLLGSFFINDSDADMPSDWFTLNMDISDSSPVCTTDTLQGATTTIVFDTTGADTFVVPSGVSELVVKTWGAGGGSGSADDANGPGGAGGGGGFAAATISVTPSETLDIHVGGGGGGGANNGTGGGGGGGGRSSVYRSATALVVGGAGAGGGGGDNSGTGVGGAGGAGGGSTGGTGGLGGTASGGVGGSQVGGGAGGSSAGLNPGTAGASLSGGDGGQGETASGQTGGEGNQGITSGGDGGRVDTNNYGGGGGGASGYLMSCLLYLKLYF